MSMAGVYTNGYQISYLGAMLYSSEWGNIGRCQNEI